jgi:hypothetical protein
MIGIDALQDVTQHVADRSRASTRSFGLHRMTIVRLPVWKNERRT